MFSSPSFHHRSKDTDFFNIFLIILLPWGEGCDLSLSSLTLQLRDTALPSSSFYHRSKDTGVFAFFSRILLPQVEG
ncbi:MAG: hypothetical protein IKZ72_05670 [Bacteroidales bacterium]|nr:hypothetical protein [Bacteroidales bacterium]